GSAAKLVALLFVHVKRVVYLFGQIVLAERDARAPGDFGVFLGIPIQNKRTATHGFDQRGVSAADFGGVYVRKTVRAQFLITAPVDCTRHDDARIAGGAYLADIILGIRRVSDERELEVRIDRLKGLPHVQWMILRLHATA